MGPVCMNVPDLVLPQHLEDLPGLHSQRFGQLPGIIGILVVVSLPYSMPAAKRALGSGPAPPGLPLREQAQCYGYVSRKKDKGVKMRTKLTCGNVRIRESS